MSKVEETIDVDVPLRTVYDQWTQFEEFPRFMEGVEDVRQIDDRHLHWRTKVAGATREFDTEIVDQLPDQRVTWRTVGGDVRQVGTVSFQQLDAEHTRVRLAMDVETEGVMEKAADAMGLLDRRVRGDLKRFKGFIEGRGHETGGWRGRVRPADADTATDAGPSTSTGAPTGEDPGQVLEEPGPKNLPGPNSAPVPTTEIGSMTEPGPTTEPGSTGASEADRSWPVPPGPHDPGPRPGM
ncbi:SRPBCC family protein [Streptomyces sp. NPDC058664]|uniref:SRPBCC family protein n=1 Tax=unclassified Streptomyces TaxID=2593676 RepID=UPI00365D25D3